MSKHDKEASTVLTVAARPWKRGWELEFGDEQATSVRHLKDAEQQVIDYLDTFHPGTDHSGLVIDIVPDPGMLQAERPVRG